MKEKKRLENKVTVITGSGRGMGRAAALLFAREGAKVVVVDRIAEIGKETVGMIKDSGGEAIFVEVDVSKKSDVQNMIKATIGKYGKLHVLYNNAAIFLPGIDGPVTKIDENTWDKIHNVNLKGVFLCCKYGIPEIIKSGGGSVINVSSSAGIIGIADYDAYTATKGGIIALTRSMAVEYAPYKIRVNCIIPGTIETPMVADSMRDPGYVKRFLSMTPTGRFGKPEEIAYLALYLASEESSYAVGGVFVVDGGMSIV